MAGFRGYFATAALAGTVLAAAAAAAAPLVGSAGDMARLRALAPVSLDKLGSISSFTPTIRDPKLSSAYTQAALNSSGKNFRFTPTSGSMSGRRSITVLVRADSMVSRRPAERSAGALGIAPLAFNLDASRGWRKFALPETMGRKPLDPVSTDLEGVQNFSLNRGAATHSRLKANVQLENRHDVGATSTMTGERQYSVDVASSYSLTRNLNVTAGVRYAGPDTRLVPLTDQRQDNQAVYVGTIFKF